MSKDNMIYIGNYLKYLRCMWQRRSPTDWYNI